MTKKQLIKWLEGKQTDALLAVSEQHAKALAKHTEALHIELGIADIVTKIKPLLEQADDLITDWRKKKRGSHVTMVDYYNSLHTRLYYFIKNESALYEALITTEFQDTTKERKQIEHTKNTLNDEVKRNYTSVIANIQSLKNAKLGIEYLTELGFDLSELIAIEQAPVTTALAVPVDTKFLFLANKED